MQRQSEIQENDEYISPIANAIQPTQVLDKKTSLAEQAKHFFESNPYEKYRQFVGQQAPENQPEALLYAGDYALLCLNVNEAIQRYEEAHTLAIKNNSPNENLIAAIKLSLMVAHEHIETDLKGKPATPLRQFSAFKQPPQKKPLVKKDKKNTHGLDFKA